MKTTMASAGNQATELLARLGIVLMMAAGSAFLVIKHAEGALPAWLIGFLAGGVTMFLLASLDALMKRRGD